MLWTVQVRTECSGEGKMEKMKKKPLKGSWSRVLLFWKLLKIAAPTSMTVSKDFHFVQENALVNARDESVARNVLSITL